MHRKVLPGDERNDCFGPIATDPNIVTPHQHEARPLRCRLPDRRVAFEGGIGSLQIVVGDDTQHMVGGLVALLHPGVNVVAAIDLPFVDARRMPKRC